VGPYRGLFGSEPPDLESPHGATGLA